MRPPHENRRIANDYPPALTKTASARANHKQDTDRACGRKSGSNPRAREHGPTASISTTWKARLDLARQAGGVTAQHGRVGSRAGHSRSAGSCVCSPGRAARPAHRPHHATAVRRVLEIADISRRYGPAYQQATPVISAPAMAALRLSAGTMPRIVSSSTAYDQVNCAPEFQPEHPSSRHCENSDEAEGRRYC